MTEPKATMEEAWVENDRLWTESERLEVESECLSPLRAESERLEVESAIQEAEGSLVVILTAQALYGKDCRIDWVNHTVERGGH